MQAISILPENQNKGVIKKLDFFPTRLITSTRLFVPNFLYILFRCDLTVPTPVNRSSAISLFDLPCMSNLQISLSLKVSNFKFVSIISRNSKPADPVLFDKFFYIQSTCSFLFVQFLHVYHHKSHNYNS